MSDTHKPRQIAAVEWDKAEAYADTIATNAARAGNNGVNTEVILEKVAKFITATLEASPSTPTDRAVREACATHARGDRNTVKAFEQAFQMNIDALGTHR